jgi:hypothetical protein
VPEKLFYTAIVKWENFHNFSGYFGHKGLKQNSANLINSTTGITVAQTTVIISSVARSCQAFTAT